MFELARHHSPSLPRGGLLSVNHTRRHSSWTPESRCARRPFMRLFQKLAFILAGPAMAACAAAPAPQAAVQARTTEQFVIAANPLAAEAGLNILKRGGSAVDAAVAIQAMLSLVEPQSSGVGGGAFMTYFDARTGKIVVYDGREVAPAQAVSTMFLDPSARPLPFNTAVVSG